MTPPVTVAVLNYRRFETLKKVLESALKQDYPKLEVVVVDNGSGEETTARIRAEFPSVRLIALPANIGTAARNHGIQSAQGEFVVTLDNDVYFDDSHALSKIVQAFQRHPAAGCVVFRVFHPRTGRLHLRDWCHPRPWKTAEMEEFETHYITEGAAAFRASVFERVAPYWEPLFIGHEGFDLAVRMLDAGYQIWYLPDVKVWHEASLETRQDWRPFYYYTRNLFPIIYRTFPWRRALPYLLPRVSVLGLYALRAGAFGRHLAGIYDGLRMMWRYRSYRRPVRAATLAKIRQLKCRQSRPVARLRLARDRVMPLSD